MSMQQQQANPGVNIAYPDHILLDYVPISVAFAASMRDTGAFEQP